MTNGKIIELHNVAFVLSCNWNLILLGQLWKGSIIYYDKPFIMILIKGGKIIAHTKKNCNLFTLDVIILKQVISAISKVITITR